MFTAVHRRGGVAAGFRTGGRRSRISDRELPGPHRQGRERQAGGQRMMRRSWTDGLGGGQIIPQVREVTRVKFRIMHRRAAVLLAFLAILLGVPLTAPASYAAASTGWIRLGNLSATTSAVDVYVYSSGDSSAQFVISDVAYGMVSAYRSVSAGDYSIKMRAAGSAASSRPVLSAAVTVRGGKAYT
ncbi:MAG: DUF4397 domain-containing protein, partial [Streptosporangiaceae bacterium]